MEIEINQLCDKKSEAAQSLYHGEDMDPFSPDQICGITHNGIRLHGSPKAAILMANHGNDLKDYIYKNQTGPYPHSTVSTGRD